MWGGLGSREAAACHAYQQVGGKAGGQRRADMAAHVAHQTARCPAGWPPWTATAAPGSPLLLWC